MEAALMTELECPVCMEIMTDPRGIVLCANGHNMCGKCRNLVRACPQCSARFITTNLPLQAIASKLKVMCKLEFNSKQTAFDALEKTVSGLLRDAIGNIIADEVKCLNCGCYSFSTIQFCIRGHSICSKCTTCSRCLNVVTVGRNFALENIAKVTIYSCANKQFGCPNILTLYEAERHGKQCKFRLVTCPLVDFKNVVCKWTGPFHDLKSHFTRDHVACTLIKESNVAINLKYTSHTIIFQKGNMVVISVANTYGTVYFRVKCASEPNEGESYLVFSVDGIVMSTEPTTSCPWKIACEEILHAAPKAKITLHFWAAKFDVNDLLIAGIA